MPWYFWVGAISLVTVVGVVKGKRTRRKVWRSIRRYADKRRRQRIKARGKARTIQRQQRPVRPVAQSPWKPAPLLTASPVAPRPVLRIQRCSAACRTSRKPASTCDCACRGRDHGRYRTGSAASLRAVKYSTAQQKAQRSAVNATCTQRWTAKQQRLQGKGKPVTRGGKGG